MKKYYRSLFLFISLFFLLTCKNSTGQEESDLAKTLESLKKVDNFPLYVMHYFGDYNFQNFLEVGTQSLHKSESKKNEIKWACTCFSTLNKQADIFFGRNFDWYDHSAMFLHTNPPGGYASVSMVDLFYLGYEKNENIKNKPDRLLQTPYYPFDGMNEKGVAIGIMAVPMAQPPNDEEKVTISSLHVIRLVLDYATNVQEAISLIRNYNIDFSGGPPLHYLITDSSRNSVIIEFINNEMKIIRSDDSWQVATNFNINGLSQEAAKYSCWRYNKAWNFIENSNGIITKEKALDILNSVSQSNTIWSIVYNLTKTKINVVMGKKFDQIHAFNFD